MDVDGGNLVTVECSDRVLEIVEDIQFTVSQCIAGELMDSESTQALTPLFQMLWNACPTLREFMREVRFDGQQFTSPVDLARLAMGLAVE